MIISAPCLKIDLHPHISHVMRLSQSTSAIEFATQTKLDIGIGLLRFRVKASVGFQQHIAMARL